MIPAMYEQCLNKCKKFVQEEEISSVCLTTDCWTSINGESFLAVTMHFVDKLFNVRQMLLKCHQLNERHTSINLARALQTIIEEWSLTNKVSLIVSDNAANIKKAIEDLGMKHLGCFAHSLNLIVQDALKLVEPTITKVKSIVTHFKKSSAANAKLMQYQKNLGTSCPKKILQDVSTRWNSTFVMLQRFVELEESIRSTIALLNISLPIITLEEWDLIKNLVDILRPFETVTSSVSGEKYISASLVIVFTACLLNVMEEMITSGELKSDLSNQVIAKLKNGLQTRFTNIEFNVTLAANTFLDPRFKLLPFQSAVAADQIKKKVTNMAADLVVQIRAPPQPEMEKEKEPTTGSESTRSKYSLWSSLDNKISKKQPIGTGISKAIIEVQRYIEDDILNKDEDSLLWWKNNRHNYPTLSSLVRNKFALATSVPCERLFSKAGQILNERRTRLSAQKVEKLLFLHINNDFLNFRYSSL
ncbi:E3 SUMO-protein ligase ZBED1-like [Diabrotica undecimpunctata]|uniref:E3 SUMO-protein ligase ZBED1-like n=1 Tax=Diabrotica undecimpunctata TaxID=50387 RepID=UPI003B6403DB